MVVEFDVIERAAFACFAKKLEDSFKRLLILYTYRIVENNPNITSNQAFTQILKVVNVKREDFECAVHALEKPLQALTINSYKREGKTISHLNPSGSELWEVYSYGATKKHPELKLWLRG